MPRGRKRKPKPPAASSSKAPKAPGPGPAVVLPRVGYRVSDGTALAFRTDLPPSARDVHPSGILHAFRPSSSGSGSDGKKNADDDAAPDDDDAAATEEEHAFAWVENALHVESALNLLEGRGFDRSASIVFVPYSSRKNWLRRYPHAAPALVCDGDGRCVVRPLTVNEGGDDGGDGGVKVKEEEGEGKEEGIADDVVDPAEEAAAAAAAAADAAEKHARKRYKARRAANMFADKAFIPDAERDELHVEIYRYLAWLHAKVSELEEGRAQSTIPSDDADGDGDDHGGDGGGGKRKGKASARPKGAVVNLAELRGVLDKMESAFPIIPNAKEEAAAEIAAAEEAAAEAAAEAAEEETGQDPQDGEREQRSIKQEEEDRGRVDEEAMSVEPPRSDDAVPEQRKTRRPPEASSAANGPPNVASPCLLERHCTEALFRKVLARERSGKPRRRSRKRRREEGANPPCWKVEGFDEMFDRLLRYREEHGHVAVPRNHRKKDWKNDENSKLANWVNALRVRRRHLRTSGLEYEPAVPGKRGELLTKALTLERVQRLDAVGFVWSLAGPKAAWEDRFQEAVEYFEGHGRWPPHGMGPLGEWVHKQRVAFARGDASFMRDKAPKLEEVGFEWAPRGPRGRR